MVSNMLAREVVDRLAEIARIQENSRGHDREGSRQLRLDLPMQSGGSEETVDTDSQRS
jgi:hypothetical protein